MAELVMEEDLLKKVVEAIKGLVEQAYFRFSQMGLSLCALDPSRTSMVSLLLRADGFDHYHCHHHNIALGLNLVDFSSMLHFENEYTITIKTDEDYTDVVTLLRQHRIHANMITEYKLKNLHIDNDELEVHESALSAIVTIPSVTFARVCRNLGRISDTVVISVTEEKGVEFSRDCGGASVIVDKVNEASIIEMNDHVSQTFELEYLNSFTKATSVSDTVTISLGSELLGVFEYKIAERGYIRFYLAPTTIQEEAANDQPN